MLRKDSYGLETFKGIVGTTPIVAKYWTKLKKRILEDLDCTLEQKLKGTVSLLWEKAYCMWQFMVRDILVEQIT